MRRAPLLLAALLAVPLAGADSVCTPFIGAHVCVLVGAGPPADVDVYVVSATDWRSAHASAGPAGAGAAVHGAGEATSGPLDAYAGASPAGPYAGAYFCIGVPTVAPGTCGDVLRHVGIVTDLLP